MKIRMGERVFSQTGKEVGRIERVVMDPKTEEITNIVIEKGVLFKEDRIAPVNMLGAMTDKGITLLADEKEIKALPEFETEHFILYSGMNEAMKNQRGYASPLIMYPPASLMRSGAPYPSYPPISHHIDKNIPKSTVAIKHGADVFGLDGKKLGDVEQVFTDPKLECVTYFLVSRGLILKERKLIPIDWVQEVTENRIKLGVDTKVIQQLPDYPRGVPEKE
jgi:uncharacterized protein YrrD